MKRSARLMFLMALAAIFAVELGPLLGSPGNGGAFAQTTPPPPDFALSSPKVKVTYETAQCAGGPVSCLDTGSDLDSYEVNASLDANNAVDLDNDMTTNGLSVLFFKDTCTNVEYALQQPVPNNAVLHLGTLLSFQIIPGNQVHKTASGKWTIYSFEGNVPNASDSSRLTGDHLEMNLKINNNDPSKSQLHIEANADMCYFSDPDSGEPLTASDPVAMVFDVGYLRGTAFDTSSPDTDYVCVNVAPQYATRDISAVCGVGEEFRD